MLFFQKEIQLKERSRGYHLITDEIEKNCKEIKLLTSGQLHIFIKHTSASLTINENADPTVRDDFKMHINRMIPENMPYYKHNYEGGDDMPAHIKTSLLGNAILIPITDGKLNMGIWQGIYLGEHRNYGGKRHLVLTMSGNKKT